MTHERVVAATQRISGESSATCVAVIVVPVDEIVLYLFEADTEADVWDVARQAGLPCERIVESVPIRPLDADATLGPTAGRGSEDEADERSESASRPLPPARPTDSIM
jgi:hypothetical protein